MADPARAVLDLALARPPTLGAGRLVCLDGPAGSGKTSLAARLTALQGARVLHMDDLYAGWRGLDAVDGQLAGLLPLLAEGRRGSYRRWDWHASAYVEEVAVEPADLLVLEGVGSFAPAYAPLVTVLAWVTAPVAVRTARVLARDGQLAAPYLAGWQVDESRRFARLGTRTHADLIVESAALHP